TNHRVGREPRRYNRSEESGTGSHGFQTIIELRPPLFSGGGLSRRTSSMPSDERQSVAMASGAIARLSIESAEEVGDLGAVVYDLRDGRSEEADGSHPDVVSLLTNAVHLWCLEQDTLSVNGIFPQADAKFLSVAYVRTTVPSDRVGMFAD